jgi:hypothetical protein
VTLWLLAWRNITYSIFDYDIIVVVVVVVAVVIIIIIIIIIVIDSDLISEFYDI